MYGLHIDRVDGDRREEVLSGTVQDDDRNGIPDALVAAQMGGQQLQPEDHTTTSGSFRLTIENVSSPVRILVTKRGYFTWNEWVAVPQSGIRITLHPVRNADPRQPGAENVPKRSDKAEPPLVKTTTSPTWEQVRTDVAKSYVDVNVKGIVQFGTPECEVKTEAKYCRQLAHVTLQSADLTLRCYSVVAGYKFVKNEWRLEGISSAGGGCSD
jgi:hypothetical protein